MYLLDLVAAGNMIDPSIVAVDVRNGVSRRLPLPQVAGGDYPFYLVRVGKGLIFPCNTGTCSISISLRGPVRKLGDSWYFVPAPAERRVWLSRLDTASSDTVRAQKSVRQVNLKGQVTVPPVPPPHGWWAEGAVAGGLLFSGRHALHIWDPRARRITVGIRGGALVAADGHFLAWCREGCDRLHIRHLRAMTQATLVPPPGFVRFLDGAGAFSPNGRWLAVPVLRKRNYSNGGSVLVMDVRRGTASVIARTRYRWGCCELAWDSSSRWLLIRGGSRLHEILAYRVGSARPRKLQAPRSVSPHSYMAAA